MSEFEMRIPVCKWLLSRGYSPILECHSLNNCDVVGARFEGTRLVEMLAIELKLSDVRGVTRQCECHLSLATETWAAMPPDRVDRAVKAVSGSGIGVLSVTPTRVTVVRQAARHEGRNLARWQKTMYRRMDEHLWRMQHPLMFRGPRPPRKRKVKSWGINDPHAPVRQIRNFIPR